MKAQVNQAFIYIFILIIIGAITLIAFNFIPDVVDQGCNAEMAVFKENLETFADRHTDFGTYNKESLTVPCSYEKVCIINPVQQPGENVDGLVIEDNFIINQYFNEQEREINVFLIEGKNTVPLMLIPYIEVNVAECAERSAGKFNLDFEGKGKTVTVTVG